MNTFPLVRNKWSNEHVMAAVLVVAMLYMLPGFVSQPGGIVNFLVVLAAALVVDAIANFIRSKRIMCSVSAGVTAGILAVLTPGVPLWAQLAGLAAGLIMGKHIWGGAGKNPVNPAMVGILVTSLLSTTTPPALSLGIWILPALILSTPFVLSRPYVSYGFMLGMTAAVIVPVAQNGLDLTAGVEKWMSYLVIIIFSGCLVVSDPVTVTAHPVVGAVGGIVTGFIALFLPLHVNPLFLMAGSVLLLNIISTITDRLIITHTAVPECKTKIEKILPLSVHEVIYHDLTQKDKANKEDKAVEAIEGIESIGADEILRRIEKNGVFGFGGAAFPTIDKIRTVAECREAHKYLIINGAECDPGLMHDHWLMHHQMDKIRAGVDILYKCIGFDTAVLAVKDTKSITCPEGARFDICGIPDAYPVGAEKILIRKVLNKSLRKDDIPAKTGILILNVQTVCAIYDAVCKNKKINERLITVMDLPGKSTYIVNVKLGTAVQSVVDALPLHPGNIFVGGGAMQCRNASDEDVVNKTVNFIAIGDFPRYKESIQCSRCGICKANCPAGLRVDRIADLVDQGAFSKTRKYHPEECIGCASCSRNCLAGRNLAMRVKTANEELRAAQKNAAEANIAAAAE